MPEFIDITVAYGDGIGPEIMEAVLYVLKEAKARIRVQTIEMGCHLFHKHDSLGISQESLNALISSKILLKGPTINGSKNLFDSLDSNLSRALGLYVKVLSVFSFCQSINSTKYPKINLVIVNDSGEGVQSTDKHRVYDDTYNHAELKRQIKSKKIVNYAFAYASKKKRKKIIYLIDDDEADSLYVLSGIFFSIAKEYKDIEAQVMLAHSCITSLINDPRQFDVIVTTNHYGEMILKKMFNVSDFSIFADLSIDGIKCAVFEAMHSPKLKLAGLGIANPLSLLRAAISMLHHIGQDKVAISIERAIKNTLEDYSGFIDLQEPLRLKVLTIDFIKAIVRNLR